MNACSKKLALSLLLIVFSGFSRIEPAFGIPVLSLNPDSVITAGQTFTVDINITGVSDLYGFQFDLGFDPSILAAGAVAEGDFLLGAGDTFFIPGSVDELAGTLSSVGNVLLSNVVGASGNGTLATVQFTALGAGISSLSLFNVGLLDSNLNFITVSLETASLTINPAPPSVPEPTSLTLMVTGFCGYFFYHYGMRRRKRTE